MNMGRCHAGHRARLLRVLAASICSLSLLVPNRARAHDYADEAELQFRIGAQRYDAGDFRSALEHFLASNRLVPNASVLFNIGRSYEQLKQNPDAFRYYLQALDSNPHPSAKARLEEALERIRPAVAVLRVETDPPGAAIYLDRKDLGSRGTAPRALGLQSGTVRVLVELDGYEPAQSEAVEVRTGSETSIRLNLKQILGTVQVAGEPVGALIRANNEDGAVLGTVPGSFSLPPGKHALIIQKDGYQSSTVLVDLGAKTTSTVRANLLPNHGAIFVNADIPGASVTIDDRPAGLTPAALNVPVGTHRVRVSLTGFRPVDRDVVVTLNQQTRLDLQLEHLQEVIAASRTTEAVEDAPASVTIISSQELRAMAYPTVAEAIRGVRGMYLSDDRSYTTVGVRGFSRPSDYGNRILVLIDGHPSNDDYVSSSFAGFDARVDLEDIERIEVVRGPGSVVYGTSAFFGVINLVTRHRDEATHGEVGVSTALGAMRGRVLGMVRFSPDAGVWTSIAGAQSPGNTYHFPELTSDARNPDAELDANGRPIDGNARSLDGFSAKTVHGRAWYKALSAQWFWTTRNKAIPTAPYESVFGDPRTRFIDTRGFAEVRFEPQITKYAQSLSRAHINLTNFDGYLAYPAPDGLSQDTFRGRWFGVEQRFILSPLESLRITLGGEFLRHYQTKQTGRSDTGDYLLDDRGNPGRNDPFSAAAGYAIADISPARWIKASAGTRLDYFSNVSKYDVGAALSPRLAIIVRPYARGNIKILAGKAFRTPSVYELHYTSLTSVKPNNLQPEQVYSGELEYSHQVSNTTRLIAAGFANYVTNLIELNTLESGLDQYGNSQSAVLVIGSEYEVRREWRQGWMVAASWSIQNARYMNSDTLRKVPNSPVHLASLKGAMPLIGRSLTAATRLSVEGPRPDQNNLADGPKQEFTQAGVIWDLVLSGQADPYGMRYSVGAYNLADWRYDIVPSTEFRQRTIVQSGRTFLASISVTF